MREAAGHTKNAAGLAKLRESARPRGLPGPAEHRMGMQQLVVRSAP
jgi:hypothetical protein